MIWNNIKAIIFDFDDTLIHSGRSVIEAIYATAEKMKLPKPSEEAIIRLRGIPLFETVQALWPFADTERAVETYLRVYSDDKVTLIDGVNETLLKLKNNGLELHILTSKGKATLHRHISHTRLQAGLFTSIIGADMIEYHKPDGRVFNTLLQDNSPIGLIYVGDSLHDFMAAKNAGIEFIAVLTGGEKEESFRKNGARIVLPSVRELKAFPKI